MPAEIVQYFTTTVNVNDKDQTLLEDCDKCTILAHKLSKRSAWCRPAGDGSTYLYKIKGLYPFEWSEVLTEVDEVSEFGKANWDYYKNSEDVKMLIAEIDALIQNKNVLNMEMAAINSKIASKKTEIDNEKDKETLLNLRQEKQGLVTKKNNLLLMLDDVETDLISKQMLKDKKIQKRDQAKTDLDAIKGE